MKITEILEKANDQHLLKDRVNVLKENDSKMLRYIMQASFDDNVQFLLPDGEPMFTPKKTPTTNLEGLEADFPKLLKYGPWAKELRVRVERLFISMMENLPKDESALLVRIKDKKLGAFYKKLNKEVATEYLKDTVTIK